jgi:GTP-binding protein YchF
MTEISCGIVGLPNVGKSTLFNALTGGCHAAASNFPFCTIEPNISVVELPDDRLSELSSKSGSKRIVQAYMRFVDIAGLVEGASKGEGLGNKFLANIRETGAILHVVRCFEDLNITHVIGNVDPVRDSSIINTELILGDIQMLENVIMRLSKQIKLKKELAGELQAAEKCLAHLNEGLSLRSLKLAKEEAEAVKNYPFLTVKPMIYAANISEDDLKDPSKNVHIEAIKRKAEVEGACLLVFCAELEAQIAELELQERQLMLEEMGLKESGLERIIKAAFSTLGLITFITTGEMETRAWTIAKGSNAQEAASEIHSDIARGFIRAEVITYHDFMTLGRQGAKDAGLARFEGRQYLVQDGDIILFYHN